MCEGWLSGQHIHPDKKTTGSLCQIPSNFVQLLEEVYHHDHGLIKTGSSNCGILYIIWKEDDFVIIPRKYSTTSSN